MMRATLFNMDTHATLSAYSIIRTMVPGTPDVYILYE